MENKSSSQVIPSNKKNVTSSTAKPRRGVRFSLRTLLFLITISCFMLSAWSVFVQPYRSQASALLLVSQCQGTVEIEQEIGSEWHRWLVVKMLGEDAFVRVVSVDLRTVKPTDELLQSLGKLRYLRSLQLDRIGLDNSIISGLKSLRQLRKLSLRYTPITEQGVASLAGLPQLEELVLTGAKISDAAIPDLTRLISLRELFIRWTSITNAGAERLKSALPECKIHHHQLTPAT